MTSDEPNTAVEIRFAGSQKLDEPTRRELHELRDEIASHGYAVSIPIRRTADGVWASLGHVAITISCLVGTGLLGAVTKDIYESAKKWVKKRYDRAEEDGVTLGATYITIYGPDGTPLKNILAKDKDDIKEIEPTANKHDIDDVNDQN